VSGVVVLIFAMVAALLASLTIAGSSASVGSPRIASELRALGVSGYTKTEADGWGLHGSRQFGIVDGANVRMRGCLSITRRMPHVARAAT
jgi:hypothetical protein